MANFLFAIFALAVMYMVGVQSLKPVVGEVTQGSRAESANIEANQQIIKIGEDDISTWQDATFSLMSRLGEQSVVVTLRDQNYQKHVRTLNLDGWKLDQQDVPPLTSIGIVPFRPQATLTVAQINKGSAAERAGLQVNDTIAAVNGENISDWTQ